jgi:phosphoribosylformylglycinamidine (FGAM) synthase-like enzyme
MSTVDGCSTSSVVTKIVVPSRGTDGASALVSRRVRVPKVKVHLAFYVETDEGLTDRQRDLLLDVMQRPGYADATVDFDGTWRPGSMYEIGYQIGITDNESASIQRACEFVGIATLGAKANRIYESNYAGFRAHLTGTILNPNVEEIYDYPPTLQSLVPFGKYEAPAIWNLLGMGDDELLQLGRCDGRNLDLDQMRKVVEIQKQLGLEAVTDVLLESLDARWSDHFYHVTWRALGDLLGQLRQAAESTRNPNIVNMFSDNAGVWDFYGGSSLVVKAETHNGPTAVSAYFGQLTKLGGVLRDILGTGLGGDPIGVFEYTATGLLDQPAAQPDRPSPAQIAAETAIAVSEYGNTFGVPMAWSRMDFHAAYVAKPFALGGSLGIIPTRFAKRGTPRAGDVVVLIGGLTGNDGIHGASASSAGGAMVSGSVQIGSPLEEVKFRQALMDLRDADCIRAINDVGGGGLNSAVGEMGDPGGVWLNTAAVPLKTAGLPMWRILLSESQERMVVAIPKDMLEKARVILERHEVQATAIGRFDGSGCFTVFHDDDLSEREIVEANDLRGREPKEVGLAVPYRLLEYRPPSRVVPPYRARPLTNPQAPELTIDCLADVLTALMGDLRVASQNYFSSRYDSTVQGRVRHGPSFHEGLLPCSYWAAQPLEDLPAAALLVTAFDPYLFEIDPVVATAQMFSQAAFHLAWAGVAVRDIAMCDNFYTPDKTLDWASILVEMVRTLAAFSRVTGIPLISGKDSSAGSVQTRNGWVHVPPAVFLSAVGKVPDFRNLRPNAWQEARSHLVLIGPRTGSLNGTVFACHSTTNRGTGLDPIEARTVVRAISCIEGLDKGAALSYLPVGAGGALAAIARAALALDRTVILSSDLAPLELVREHRLSVIAEVPEAALGTLPAFLEPVLLGQLGKRGAGIVAKGRQLLSRAAIDAWRDRFEEAVNR